MKSLIISALFIFTVSNIFADIENKANKSFDYPDIITTSQLNKQMFETISKQRGSNDLKDSDLDANLCDPKIKGVLDVCDEFKNLLLAADPEDLKLRKLIEEKNAPSLNPEELNYEQQRIFYIGALFCAATYIESKKINGGNNYQECWDELEARGWNPKTIVDSYNKNIIWPGEYVLTGQKFEDGKTYYFLAIRGTVYSWQWYSVNMVFLPTYYPDSKKRVHAGFCVYTASFAQSPEVAQFIEKAKNDKNGKLVICGQSLGGASAVLMAETAIKYYNFPKEKLALLTIAQPCVGFPEFVEMVKADLPEYYRIADYCDVVVWVLLLTDLYFKSENVYQHFGTRVMTWPLTDYNKVLEVIRNIQAKIKEEGIKAIGTLIFGSHIMKNYLPYIKEWTKDYNEKSKQ